MGEYKIEEITSMDYKGLLVEEAKRRVKKGAISPYPTQLSLEITSRCNLRCNYCQPLREKLNMDKYRYDIDPQFIYQLDEMLPYVSTVVFTGYGEPLLNKNIFDFIKFIRKYNKKTSIILPTNGTQDLNEAELETLAKNNINVLVSLDSINTEVQNITRPNTISENVMKNIRKISNVMKIHGDVIKGPIVNTVLTKHSIGNMLDFTKFVIDVGCMSHCFLTMVPDGPSPEFYKNNALLSEEDKEKMKLELMKCHELTKGTDTVISGTLLNEYKETNGVFCKLLEEEMCFDPWLFASISVLGNVGLCTRPEHYLAGHLLEGDSEKHEVVANLRKKLEPIAADTSKLEEWIDKAYGTFNQIWNGPIAQFYRKQLMERKDSKCNQCIANKMHNSWFRCT